MEKSNGESVSTDQKDVEPTKIIEKEKGHLRSVVMLRDTQKQLSQATYDVVHLFYVDIVLLSYRHILSKLSF